MILYYFNVLSYMVPWGLSGVLNAGFFPWNDERLLWDMNYFSAETLEPIYTSYAT
jgi:hypothetical protein